MTLSTAYGQLSFSLNVLRILNRYRQHKTRAPESGGILLGSEVEQGFAITRASVPNQFDHAGRRHFHRNPMAAQVIVEHEFVNSNNLVTYLGEWHTHPEKHARPSTIDLRMIEEQFHTNDISVRVLVLVVLGTRSDCVVTFDGKERALYPTNLVGPE